MLQDYTATRTYLKAACCGKTARGISKVKILPKLRKSAMHSLRLISYDELFSCVAHLVLCLGMPACARKLRSREICAGASQGLFFPP